MGDARPIDDYAQLYDEARRGRDRLLALAWAAAEAQLADSEDELLEIVCAGAVKTGLSAHAALRVEPRSDSLVIRALALKDRSQPVVERIAGRPIVGAAVSVDAQPLRFALEVRQTTLVPDIRVWLRLALPWLGEQAARRCYHLPDFSQAICAPIEDGSHEVAGVLVVWGERLSEFDTRTIALLGRLAGIALASLRARDMDHERLRLDGALLVARTAAHELNNALSLPVGYADLLTNHPVIREHPDLLSHLTLIRDGAERAAHLVQRLQHVVRLAERPTVIGTARSVLDMDRSTAKAAVRPPPLS